jgi:hypothetical protein
MVHVGGCHLHSDSRYRGSRNLFEIGALITTRQPYQLIRPILTRPMAIPVAIRPARREWALLKWQTGLEILFPVGR